MKTSLASALSLLLLVQNSLQDSPADKACKALQEKYPKLTAHGLDPRYAKANTGMHFFFFFFLLFFWGNMDVHNTHNNNRLLHCQCYAWPQMRLRTVLQR